MRVVVDKTYDIKEKQIAMKKNISRLIEELHELVNLYGVAQVAVWLGYKDTRAVLQWIQRKKIPESRLALVSFVIRHGKVLSENEKFNKRRMASGI